MSGLRAPVEQRRVNRHHLVSDPSGLSVASLRSYGGSPSPDKRKILAASPPIDYSGGSSNGIGSPGRASEFDKLLAAQALAQDQQLNLKK